MSTMLRPSTIIVTMLGCCLLPTGVMTFGVESALPIMHDLQTHLPLVHQTGASVFSTHAANIQHPTSFIELSHSVSSSISSTNNLLASSTAANNGDSTMAMADTASSLLEDYRAALAKDPLKVKIITGCLLAIVGDAIAQLGTPDDYNKKRAIAFVMFDAVWRTVQQVTYGPIIATCNGQFSMGLLGFLPFAKEENLFVLGAIEQTLVSQLILIPLLYYPIFYSVTGVVQNLTVDETITRAKDTFVQLMKRNLLFWIPVQFCAFYFVEENLQIPVLTACGLVWTVILSLSAGNVNSSSEEENTIDDDTVEEKMVSEVLVGKGAVGLPRNSFFNKSNGESTTGSSTVPAKTGESKKVLKVRK